MKRDSLYYLARTIEGILGIFPVTISFGLLALVTFADLVAKLLQGERVIWDFISISSLIGVPAILGLWLSAFAHVDTFRAHVCYRVSLMLVLICGIGLAIYMISMLVAGEADMLERVSVLFVLSCSLVAGIHQLYRLAMMKELIVQ